jgi:Hint domain
MMKLSPTAEGLIRNRRRPGRSAYTNLHLIELLRQQNRFVRSLAEREAETERWDKRRIARAEAAANDTISVMDGGSQAGHPGQGSGHAWDRPVLANQVCYVAGERVVSSHGVVPVECLTAGDLVMTRFGEKRVTWVRRFDLAPASGPHPERSAPVRLRRDAIAAGRPAKDLLVSPSHRLWADGRLVPAWCLVDGDRVVQDLARASVSYCHVLFGPAPQRVAPVFHTVAGSATPAMTEPVVRLVIDGKAVDPVERDGARLVFIVPQGCRAVQIASAGDAAVVQIDAITDDSHDVIPADHPGLSPGWDVCERDGHAMWRRVSGLGEVPIGLAAEHTTVVVTLRP